MTVERPTAYLGNPNLKPAGTPHNFTEKQLEEFVKCSGDPEYFIENYIKVVHVDLGIVPFKLYVREWFQDYCGIHFQFCHPWWFV